MRSVRACEAGERGREGELPDGGRAVERVGGERGVLVLGVVLHAPQQLHDERMARVDLHHLLLRQVMLALRVVSLSTHVRV